MPQALTDHQVVAAVMVITDALKMSQRETDLLICQPSDKIRSSCMSLFQKLSQEDKRGVLTLLTRRAH